MNKIQELIDNHKLLKQETWEQLNELNKIDVSKFSAKEKTEIEQSVTELEQEYSMRVSFLSELESLL